MKAASIVKLFCAGWQVPQVRPLPLNVSRKKMSAPAQISRLTSLVTPRILVARRQALVGGEAAGPRRDIRGGIA